MSQSFLEAAADRTKMATSMSKSGLQSAFVFAKPHANRHFAIEAIKAKFAEMEIGILKEGEITGEQIDEFQYIDQHCACARRRCATVCDAVH